MQQNISAMDHLQQIGSNLNKDIVPRILDGGIVIPSNTATPTPNWVPKEFDYERETQRRSSTGTWTRPSGRQRPSSGTGATCPTGTTVCTDLKTFYETGMDAVEQAYPGARVWWQEQGLWLWTECSLLPEDSHKAVFLTAIPFARTHIVRAWGFWTGAPFASPTWIGPRHTNFDDGSVCAFDPGDGSWLLGDSIVDLLDIYTRWAICQLHLKLLGKWPGRQVAHLLFERIVEIKSDELCGCGSAVPYGECHQRADKEHVTFAAALDYFTRARSTRTPPPVVLDFVRRQTDPPRAVDVLPRFS